ncbi:hypothetical protein H4R33_006753 [Dimargaris cristalligena]|nr:hypothetical protein H4R33_006753 [Dimargaris cristalligena]
MPCFQEQETIPQQIKITESQIPFVQYADVKDRSDNIKEEYRTIYQNYVQLQRQHQPHLGLKVSVAHNIEVTERRKNSMDDTSWRFNY